MLKLRSELFFYHFRGKKPGKRFGYTAYLFGKQLRSRMLNFLNAPFCDGTRYVKFFTFRKQAGVKHAYV